MSKTSLENRSIPVEKFAFVNRDEKLTDTKFVDKPVGYLKDAWIRFCKNKGSIVAAIIIAAILMFAFLTPAFFTRYDLTFMDVYYSKKAPRNIWLRDHLGICDGTVERDFNEKNLILMLGIGVGAEDYEGSGKLSIADGKKSYYQPMREIGDPKEVTGMIGSKDKTIYTCRLDTYLEYGFQYRSIEQSEYSKIREYEEATGIHVLYPLVEDNEWNFDPANANYWYKSKKGTPVKLNKSGKGKEIPYSEDMVLEDNYMRDEEGNPLYYIYTGGGDIDSAQYKVRVLYYNYYRYVNGFEPEYLFGTDSQGYDLMLRLASGIKLSFLVALAVSAINLTIGAIYGAIEGYYGGTTDLVMERISDIINNVPFIVVATLFQLHLAVKVGPIVCLLFAYVTTGWIGMAYRVRTQFYRFKNQEYVMAARTLGASDSRIIWKHIFPNSLGTIITSSVLVIPGVISGESMLSFLGIVKLGNETTTSLGTLLADSSSIWTTYPHLMIFPALVISLLMICFNLFGNGLRDAFNPSLRGVEE
ncbi:MAG: ABC transporter permease [Lachnospiraceae bacterium]|nr:ABC transporter permease [Lachnospiraceae bacterium]